MLASSGAPKGRGCRAHDRRGVMFPTVATSRRRIDPRKMQLTLWRGTIIEPVST
jgi:hypothetical protein